MLIIEAIIFSLILVMSGEEQSTLEFSLSLALQWLRCLLVKVSHFYCYLPVSCPTPSKAWLMLRQRTDLEQSKSVLAHPRDVYQGEERTITVSKHGL